jgi:hypothetical protein
MHKWTGEAGSLADQRYKLEEYEIEVKLSDIRDDVKSLLHSVQSFNQINSRLSNLSKSSNAYISPGSK